MELNYFSPLIFESFGFFHAILFLSEWATYVLSFPVLFRVTADPPE